MIVLFIPMLLAAAGTDDVRKELKALQGTWKAVGIEAGGKSFPKEFVPPFTFTIGADGKATGKTPKGEYDAKISVDPSKKPRTIENMHETGDHKGKKQYGIYKLEGDKFTVAMTAPGAEEKDRPKDFMTTKETPFVIFIFERVKDEKKP
jgi:uncharacterized protein (TIGR03067 family)